MIRYRVYGWIIYLTVFFLFFEAGAQPVDYFQLENAIKKGNRQETGRLFFSLCTDLDSTDKNTSSAIKILAIAHELSRSGMADLVWPGLKHATKIASVNPHYNDSLKLKIETELGAALYYDNRFRQADSVFRTVLNRFDDAVSRETPEYALNCNFLGMTSMRMAKPDTALTWFERAKSVRIMIYGEDHPLVGAIYNNMGLLCKNRGDYTGAVQNYRKAIIIKQKTGDPSVSLNLLNLGELFGIRGQYAEALSLYRKADSILSREAPTLRQADLYMNSGAMLYHLQGYEDAREYFLKALRIYESLSGENTIWSGKVYQNLANVYHALGEGEEEYKSVVKALEIFEHELVPGHPDLASLYNNLGLIFQNRKDFSKSIGYLEKAREIYLGQPEGQLEKTANTIINIAETYRLAGIPDSAIAAYRQAISMLGKPAGGKHPYLACAYNAMARIFLTEGRYTASGALAEKAIRANLRPVEEKGNLLESCLDPGYLLESLLLQGQIAWKSDLNSSGQAEISFSYFRKADTLLSLQRNSLFNTSDKITFSKNTGLLAESALECLARHGKARESSGLFAEGFRYAEKSRNLVLLQSFQEEGARRISGIPDSLQALESELKGNIFALTHQLETSQEMTNAGSLEEQLFREKRRYRSLVENLEKEYPVYREMKNSDQVPDIPGLQAQLEEDMALLAYFSGDSAIYRFTVLKNQVLLERSVVADKNDLLTGYRKGIYLRLDDVYREKADQLYRCLFPSALPEEVRKLVIIPDAALSVIPFEALLFAVPNKNDTYSEWPFLIKNFEISYAPSLALWKKGRENPGWSGLPRSALSFAPVFNPEGGEPGEGQTRGMIQHGRFLESLPSTRDEVVKIDSLFRKLGYGSEYRLTANATENELRTTDLSKIGYLHIATHGTVNEKDPGLSGLYFYPVKDNHHDNILYMGEIYHLKLNARLVVLSACETGLGKVASGEGILGFSRAFLLAGARNLLLSLWQVNDVSTTRLMTSFYKSYLENSLSLAESLRDAKLELIRIPGTSHPYFWAPFVLTGN